MIFYSHFWDLLLKALLLLALVVTLIVVNLGGSPALWPAIIILALLYVVIYRQFLTTISAWLYARLSLRTPLSLAEARQLARLVQLDASLKWIPLKPVKTLPPDERKPAIMAAVARMTPQRRTMLL